MSKNTQNTVTAESTKSREANRRNTKVLKVVVTCGMMGALAIVLSLVATIKVLDYLRIGFSGIPNQVVCYLFGPVVGMIFGGAMDILKYIINPTGPFFPGYTLTAMVAGLIYGFFFYKKPIKLWRVIAAHVCVKLFCNLGLNTIWVIMTTGKAVNAIIVPRIIANAGALPADVILLMIILPIAKMCKEKFIDN